MALALTSSVSAISPRMIASFLASGGTEPYVYSVLSGGGSIASNGVYTAPTTTGVAVIQVEDDDGALATHSIIIGTALQLFCDIIQTEMGLAADQVWLWDQKINIPKDSRLYVAVAVLNCKPYSNVNRFDSAGNEVQSVNMQATLSVDILSRSLDAVNRKEEVILALGSIYSEQQQEINSFYVAKISSGFVNLSQEDGAAIPYRFNISVNIQYVVTKTKAVPYYDNFEDSEVITDP